MNRRDFLKGLGLSALITSGIGCETINIGKKIDANKVPGMYLGKGNERDALLKGFYNEEKGEYSTSNTSCMITPNLSFVNIDYQGSDEKPFVCLDHKDKNKDGKLTLDEFMGISDKFQLGKEFIFVQKLPDNKQKKGKVELWYTKGESSGLMRLSKTLYSTETEESNALMVDYLVFMAGDYLIRTVSEKEEISSVKIEIVK